MQAAFLSGFPGHPGFHVIIADQANMRIIVVNVFTGKIVWQYGHTGVAGSGPGYLNDPDGVDMLPPLSLTVIYSRSMGEYPVPPGT